MFCEDRFRFLREDRIAKRAEQACLLAFKEAAEEARARADWEARAKAREEQVREEQVQEEQAREEQDQDEGCRAQEEEKILAVVTRKKPAPWILARKNNTGTLRRSDGTGSQSPTRCPLNAD